MLQREYVKNKKPLEGNLGDHFLTSVGKDFLFLEKEFIKEKIESFT